MLFLNVLLLFFKFFAQLAYRPAVMSESKHFVAQGFILNLARIYCFICYLENFTYDQARSYMLQNPSFTHFVFASILFSNRYVAFIKKNLFHRYKKPRGHSPLCSCASTFKMIPCQTIFCFCHLKNISSITCSTFFLLFKIFFIYSDIFFV